MCFDSQVTVDQQVGGLDHEECKDRCTTDPSCIAFASHPQNNFCYITLLHRKISQWTKTTHLMYTCYAKSSGISYKRFLFIKILLFCRKISIIPKLPRKNFAFINILIFSITWKSTILQGLNWRRMFNK